MKNNNTGFDRINLGYACINLDTQGNFKTCRLKNVTDEKLKELIKNNLSCLDEIMDYNIENNIRLYRISADLIPFATAECNTLDWEKLFSYEFNKIAKKINENNIRVTMHAGHFTVINSPNEEVVRKSIADLFYLVKVLDAFSTGIESKIILHIGGVYGDKIKAIKNFISTYNNLSKQIRDRLVIENDDKSFTVSDVLYISEKTGCPVVFDNLHNRVNSSLIDKTDAELIDMCADTWDKSDGTQKIHYSQQNIEKNAGAHSDTIDVVEFSQFLNNVKDKSIDIMLEVKDKNRSVIKCKEYLNIQNK